MRPLEDFLKPTQGQLFDTLRKMYRGKTIVRKKKFLLVPGEAPVMLVAHLDTVHKEPVRDICKTDNGNILMSPQGIGGDDRCGVYALVNAHEAAEVKPWLLFTCDEEIGGRGAEAFVDEHGAGKLPKELDELKLIVEIDRRGSKDAVYYECDNPEFEKYITSKGFKTEFGSFSDISYIAPELGVAAVNLSSGYYNAHTLYEYINRKQLNKVVAKVGEIITDATAKDFPKYEYVERFRERSWLYGGSWLDYNLAGHRAAKGHSTAVALKTEIPKALPVRYQQMYDELLDLYHAEELEYYRETHGDGVIEELYREEFMLCDDPYEYTDTGRGASKK